MFTKMRLQLSSQQRSYFNKNIVKKLRQIERVLREQTCNLFSQEWYEFTVGLLFKLDKKLYEYNDDLLPKFNELERGVKHYNSKIDPNPAPHIKTFMNDLEKFCASEGLVLEKGRGNRGRYFVIYETEHGTKINTGQKTKCMGLK